MEAIRYRVVTAAMLGGLLSAAAGWAQDDKLADCPDPDAARKYVKQCLQQNPYNTEAVCIERALEQVCGGKK
jgi:hypothetical protein